MTSPSDTLSSLHRIAAHVLARRRFQVSGRFGLRASPGGIATRAFGDGPEVLRLAGPVLIRESGGTSAAMTVTGSTLRLLADFAGTDLDAPFSCGDDTPELGDPDAPVLIDPARLAVLVGWYDLGWRALDAVIAALPVDAAPATLQLWPEHLDVGTNVGVCSKRADQPGLLARRHLLGRSLRLRRAMVGGTSGRPRLLERPVRRRAGPGRRRSGRRAARAVHRVLADRTRLHVDGQRGAAMTNYVVAGDIDGRPVDRPCGHLGTVRDVAPNTPGACEDCLREGSEWVHLRLCLECGHVGCCDNSPPPRTAARASTSPIMRSLGRVRTGPGATWKRVVLEPEDW